MIDRQRYKGMVRCLNCRFAMPKRQESPNETTIIFCNRDKVEKIDHALRHCEKFDKKIARDVWYG